MLRTDTYNSEKTCRCIVCEPSKKNYLFCFCCCLRARKKIAWNKTEKRTVFNEFSSIHNKLLNFKTFITARTLIFSLRRSTHVRFVAVHLHTEIRTHIAFLAIFQIGRHTTRCWLFEIYYLYVVLFFEVGRVHPFQYLFSDNNKDITSLWVLALFFHFGLSFALPIRLAF